MDLRESCAKYSRKYRSNREKLLSFHEFNNVHGTCLTENRTDVEHWFRKIIKVARQQDGVPVRRRLPSLFNKFSSKVGTLTEIKVSQNKRLNRSLDINAPSIKNKGRFPLRPTSIAPTENDEEEEYTFEDFKEDAIEASKIDKRLQHKNNMFVYFFDGQRPDVFASQCVKLNKQHADVLRKKSEGELVLRSGELAPSNWKWSQLDVEKITKAAKAKENGPFFLHLE